MKRTLVLIRHAKSDRDLPWPDDFSRPLSMRGTHDAVRLAPMVLERIERPTVVLSSPAVRALSTASIFCRGMDGGHALLQVLPQLYHATPQAMAQVLSTLADDCRTVLLFAHEPGLSALVSMLRTEPLHHLPTCGAVGLGLHGSTWAVAMGAMAEPLFHITPKKTG